MTDGTAPGYTTAFTRHRPPESPGGPQSVGSRTGAAMFGTGRIHAFACQPKLIVQKYRDPKGRDRRRRSGALAIFCLLPAFALPAEAQNPPLALDTLLVTGVRASAALPAMTRGVEVIGADELVSAPARSLGDLLVWALGVDVLARSAAHSEPVLRGGTSRQVLVLLDGMRVSDGPTGPFTGDLAIPLEDIERIEILRGPASPAYGTDAVAGVVNVITRRRVPPVITGRIETGSFSSHNAAAGARIGRDRRRVTVGVEHRRSEGHRPGTDFRGTHARVAARLPTGERELRARIAADTRDFGAAGFYAPYPPYDAYHESRTMEASLAWDAAPGARLAIEPQVRIRTEQDDFLLKRADPSYFRNVHSSWRAGGDITATYRFSPPVQLLVGAEAYRDHLSSSNAGLPADHCSLERHCSLDETRASLFAEMTAGTMGHAAATLGVRGDWHSTYGVFAAPSIAVAIWPADALRLRAAAGSTQRVPSWTERFYQDSANVASPRLAPEEAWSGEIGADISPTPRLRIAFAGFVRRVDTLIDWVRPDSLPDAPWSAANIQDATFDGLESELSLIDVLGTRITVRASALTHEAPGMDSLVSKLAFRPLNRSASLVVDRELAGLMISTRLLHGRRRTERAFTRLDTRLSYSIGQARIYLDALNLTDVAYEDLTASRAPGQAFFVGASWGWSP